MKADCIIVNPPAVCQNLRFLQCIEQFISEKLVSHLPIEQFDIPTLPRRTGLDVQRLDRERLQPAANCRRETWRRKAARVWVASILPPPPQPLMLNESGSPPPPVITGVITVLRRSIHRSELR